MNWKIFWCLLGADASLLLLIWLVANNPEPTFFVVASVIHMLVLFIGLLVIATNINCRSAYRKLKYNRRLKGVFASNTPSR